MKVKIFFVPLLIIILATVILAFCESTKGGNGSQGGVSFPLKGKITFDEYESIRERHLGVLEVNLPKGEKRRLLSGAYSWRHPDGDVIFAQGCGSRVNRLVVSDPSGNSVTIVSPCSNEIENSGYSPSRFEFSRLSPDKSLVAAEVRYYLNDGWRYGTVVLKEGEIHQVYDNFAAPEWLPDGRLLLMSDGIYVTEVGGTPTRIDDGSLTTGPNNPDVDPAGKRIAFEWNQRIWMIGVDGSNLTELATGEDMYRFPAWSPDGKVLAFLATDGYGMRKYKKGIYFLEVATGEFQYLDLASQLDGHCPTGPLSWIE